MPFSIKITDPKCSFSAAHFLLDHEKCCRIHGHNYIVQVEIFGGLSEQSYIYDFAEVKATILSIIEELDHYFLIATNNSGFNVVEEGEYYIITSNKYRYVLPISNVKLLDIKATTAECLAYYIHQKIIKIYPENQIVVSINESYGSIASYTEKM
jgi:6-pyruvoyltetrahydropterin/6-carboxytetrahydropterin synthase